MSEAPIPEDLRDAYFHCTHVGDARYSAWEASLIERIAALEAQNRTLLKVIEAARCIRHWHDAMKDGSGMVVSAEHVRALWGAIAEYDAALAATEPKP